MRHPVLRLDFSGGDYEDPEGLRRNLTAQLDGIEHRAGVSSDCPGPERLAFLAEALIDEYDKPILDVLHEPEVARANRAFLRSLYSNIKFADAHIRFTFLTGVSKFSKVSLFSGLNNLIDITLDPVY